MVHVNSGVGTSEWLTSNVEIVSELLIGKGVKWS